jgi:uncharacterized protein (UPF0332 family)
MPVVSQADQIHLYVSNCKAAQLATLAAGPGQYPFPLTGMIRQATSDRMTLSGEHLRVGDALILAQQYRSSISRHYYAMYHAARAIVFAVMRGDDYQRHNDLPRNLPPTMTDVATREVELTAARLLRNEADYDPYPANSGDWEPDARQLAATSANFVQACEDFALLNGHV